LPYVFKNDTLFSFRVLTTPLVEDKEEDKEEEEEKRRL
tara:strand:+ start:79 stop:192 length:114 start_codon:yes stop_codon:yes gene_type:complete